MDETLNPKNRGLGRGLNALFEDDGDSLPPVATEEVSGSGKKRQSLPIEQIAPHLNQPRQHFDETALAELTASIKEHGILQPIIVRPLSEGKDARYEIIAGERRWRAAQKAMLHEVPVVVLDAGEEESYKIALIENLQREDLDPIDEAHGYDHMMASFGYTQEKVAEAVGKSRPHVANMLRLLGLSPNIQQMVRDGKLSAGHARAIATSDNPEALAADIIAGSMSVRQAEALAGSGKSSSGKSKNPREDKGHVQSFGNKDPDTILLEADLSAALGMSVDIDSRDGKKGRLTIEFKDLDQLDELLQRLSTRPASQRLMG
ncbi:MAG: ParB/RepB/Spo0J family partition protein [Alphaproteobacteria bacterium]|nr:ParB/RepB/Spo0J family partition protein [Alphaproteobacteria bacterium]